MPRARSTPPPGRRLRSDLRRSNKISVDQLRPSPTRTVPPRSVGPRPDRRPRLAPTVAWPLPARRSVRTSPPHPVGAPVDPRPPGTWAPNLRTLPSRRSGTPPPPADRPPKNIGPPFPPPGRPGGPPSLRTEGVSVDRTGGSRYYDTPSRWNVVCTICAPHPHPPGGRFWEGPRVWGSPLNLGVEWGFRRTRGPLKQGKKNPIGPHRKTLRSEGTIDYPTIRGGFRGGV
ncbi:hypothetical protein TNIN_153321 [Trichonephila inaurata madagascariensis]|uniref:Uncharacterized protein n=1 Tax=Trichonephila inaurata madagascariensis TaxID=2747483 RepID=A0A8X7C615_9ARAC|nr:hypothetical protein TNIN_153321 [Trichonephila inaurata madagascariensis]